jgi:AbrB family looped-hinge helix DNA binding protein
MAKVTSKLQVTLPKRVAQQYGIRPGSDVEFVPAGDVIRLVTGATRAAAGIAERLKLFDEATKRQRRRQIASRARRRPPSDRGWTREDLYRRGLSG